MSKGDYDLEEYTNKLEHILKRKMDNIERLLSKFNNLKKALKDEEEASKHVNKPIYVS